MHARRHQGRVSRCLAAILFWIGSLSAAVLAAPSPQAANAESFSQQRAELLRVIASDARQTAASTGRENFDPRVMQALERVPRHEFVPVKYREHAYANRPLPIGYGQTISQPYIVALMTDLLQLRPDARVLEIGTGSGYQAAVLAELVAKVYSIEIITPLAEQAASRLQRLQYHNIELRHGDGYHGWPEQAPFDAVIVTAAAQSIPPPLVAQLKPGGVLIIPVGAPFLTQSLVRVEKRSDGSLGTQRLLPVRFVPLTGERD